MAPSSNARANVGTKAQDYVVKLREDWKQKFEPDAVATAREVATNPLSARGNQKVIATSDLGAFTAARLAEWLQAIPSDLRIRESLVRAPDSIARSALTQIDSAAVAVLLAWQRAAAQRGQALALAGVTPQLRSLASLYGVEGLLGLTPAAAYPDSHHHRH